MKTNPWYNRIQRLVVQTVTLIVVTTLLYADVSHLPLIGPLFEATAPAPAEAAELPAIRVESFDQDVAADGTTFVLDNDVGDVTSAFIKLNSGTRKTSGGPTGSTANTAPDVGTAGLVLTDTTEVTVERLSSTPVKVMGEVWRYEGPAGGAHEFIVRDRLEVSLTGSTVSNFVTGVDDVDRVVPFVTGYTVNGSAVGDWEAATIAAHMDDSGNLVVSRNNSAAAATVYVDVVEFTGSAWTVCHGYSNAHDTAPQTITLNTDADGQGGATCDVGDWGAATIIEATMEGDSGETGLSDTLALVRPGATTDTIEFDIQQDTNARNDGQAWIHVLQNDDLVVNRAANADIVEGNGTYGSVLWPSGASTEADLDLLSLEWFTDTSGVGTAHMRGGLNARITQVAPIIYNDNDLVPSTDYDSTVEGNFRSTLTFAASPEGVVYEAGGTGTGAFVGYNDVGEFIVRAGSGASGAPADAARLVITPSEYDFAGRSGILRWNFYQSTNAVDLSFDEDGNGSIDYATSTTAAAAWANWSGGDDGGVGTSNGSLAGSEITSAFDFNGTITEVRFTQGGGGGYEIQHWIHRSGNNVGVDYGVVDLTNLTFDSIFQNFDTIVVATGTQAVSTDVPTNNLYVGGAFVIREKFTSRNVTGVIIAESGTVDASTGLDNIRLLYEFDTSAPYDCASESYDGSELQYGLTDTDGFSAADGTVSFTDSVSISPTQSLCLYPLLDVTTSATDGQTIELAITNPSTDVAVSGGAALGPGTLTALNGTTLLQSPDLTQVHYHWREDDGSETAASSVTGAEDTPVGGFQPGTQRRLRIAVSAEGSATADPVQFRLQFAEKAGTCEAATGWEDVAAEGGAWDIGDSPNLAFADATTNILNAAQGAVSDEELVFTGTSAVVDTGDKSLDITLADDAFTELEYTVISTAAASQGTTYCFRVVDEAPDDTHAYRIPVTIQASQVASSLSDFPVYVDLSLLGGHFFSNVASDGSDIRVTTDDGRTEIAREVVSIDTGSGTGELHFNAPSISDSANTTFYVYYGAAGEQELQASSTYGAQQVWNDNYVAVYHYDDTPSGSNSILDSTANANHGTSQGGLSGSNLTTGRLSQGYNFSGGNYYIDFPQLVGGNSQMTVSYWINNPSYNDGRAFSSGGSGLSQVLVWPDDAGGLECIIDGTRVGNSANPTGWVHHACTYDGATIRNYANSVPEGTGSKTGTIATIGSGDRFGVDGGLSAYLQDTVDELRIKSTPVSGDWLAAEYTNQTNPATFFATSSFETLTNDPVPISFSVYPEATITADVSVAAAGAATASVAVGTNDVYLGGTYSFVRDGANRTLTSITVRETRTIDAALLSNPRLFYELDTSVPYDCVSESYDGTEPSVSGTAFSGANGSTTFTLSQTLNSTQTLCGYMVVDIDTAVPDGATIALEIANPNSDVVVTSASVGPSSPVAPTGSTT
ncbi:MAG TPA: LamG-like jellyroll fold domain-containing protein, partial [Candidatus Paceibacterota bacterium]|nr:LamG-like jellyroll fold domain-containing protein [Candidatus Paceibacterota bacterium]